MKPFGWPCPRPGGASASELALGVDRGHAARLLIIPALFDEANKLRRLTVEVMRRLDAAGIDCFLPDLPGTNESLGMLEDQTLASWREAMAAAASHFQASHFLAIRGGGLLAPTGLPGWLYAPVNGASVLRQMLRARSIAAREAGREEALPELTKRAESEGIELAGYRLSAALFTELNSAMPPVAPNLSTIDQDMLDGPGLWLRAEPDESRTQADALAAVIALGIKG